MKDERLSDDEVNKLKTLIAPKVWFEYSYKNHSCNVERELSADEIEDWHKRIDEVSK